MFYSLKDYFLEKFHSKVYKITLDAGFTCPNRDGTKGFGGCIYCDPMGSGNGLLREGLSLKEQIHRGKEFLKKRYNAEKFFLYFQSFTNTYAKTEKLKEIYDEALNFGGNDIIGLIVGTRPDCIDEKKLNLLASYTDRYEVWIEYGLQSIHSKTLKFINRGHTVEDYINAVNLTKNFPLKITVHIIVGLPYESREDILETIKFIVKHNKIDAIKIHSLYIPKGSRLEKVYLKEKFKLLTMEEYINIVADIIEFLPPKLVIARITGETTKENLVAPEWVLKKQIVINNIKEELKKRNSYQGKFFKGNSV